jgi:hypothetical protein
MKSKLEEDDSDKSKLEEDDSDKNSSHDDSEHHEEAPLDEYDAKCTCHHVIGGDTTCPCSEAGAIDKHEKSIIIAVIAISVPLTVLPLLAWLIAKYFFGWSITTYGCICQRSGRGKKDKVVNLMCSSIGGHLPKLRAQRKREIQKYNRWYRKFWRYITNDTTTQEPVPLVHLPRSTSPKKSTSPRK